MTLVKRLRFTRDEEGDLYPAWLEVDVPEGPDELRERVVVGHHVTDRTDLLGSLNEEQIEHLVRVETLVRSGELDSVRWTLRGNPEHRALDCATYATCTIPKG